MDRFSYRVFKFSCDKGLIEPGDKIVVSLSGGVDSMCLFCLLLTFKKRIKFDIHLVHFNHGLREDSLGEETFLKDLATRKGVPITVFHAVHFKGTSGIQQKAREWRYHHLNETLKNLDYNKIALGHHLNDLVETQIWRLLRGASLFSLNPIDTINLPYIRPLLRIRKKELENYLLEIGQEWCEDRSNFEDDYTRNLIRNQLIPMMQQSAGDRFEEKMLALNEDAQKLKRAFEKQIPVSTIEADEIAFDTILRLDPIFSMELIHRFLLHHGQTEVSRAQIEDVYKLVKSKRGNWQIVLKNSQVVMGKNKRIKIQSSIKG